jgi:hypothetical protein
MHSSFPATDGYVADANPNAGYQVSHVDSAVSLSGDPA